MTKHATDGLAALRAARDRARQMADAAPYMYETLRAVSQLKCLRDATDKDSAQAVALRMVRAALAKVEG